MNCIKKLLLIFIVLVGVLLLVNFCKGPLVWQNLTDSGPHGIYVYAPDQQLHYGDWCVVNLPYNVPGLHVEKGYKLIKQVRAFNGESYEVKNNQLTVHHASYPITRATHLPQLADGRYVVPLKHYLFLNQPVLSFDSRYLGAIAENNLQCKVILVVDYDEINNLVEWLRRNLL